MGHLQDFIFIMVLGYRSNIKKVLLKDEFLKTQRLVKSYKSKNEEVINGMLIFFGINILLNISGCGCTDH